MLDRLAQGLRWAVMAIVSSMVVIVGLQVTLRYIFNMSLDWADEVSRLTFVWMIFLGVPLAARTRSHIALTMLVDRLAPRVRVVWSRLLALVAAVIAGVAAYEAAALCVDQWDELMASLDWSAQWFVVPVAFGMGCTALFFVEQAFCPPVNDPHDAQKAVPA
jgi:TRAP-type C4-dicarboxylate transport system permease small subunit